ncbi:hypothetical protein GOODEAATRI_022342, partial [Goodea atripinnis]
WNIRTCHGSADVSEAFDNFLHIACLLSCFFFCHVSTKALRNEDKLTKQDLKRRFGHLLSFKSLKSDFNKRQWRRKRKMKKSKTVREKMEKGFAFMLFFLFEKHFPS